MSLRYKALIAVLLLVALVTGGLGVYVSDLYREAERKRIRIDLERDARSLNLELAAASTGISATLEAMSFSKELLILFDSDSINLKDNLSTACTEWRKATDSSFALAAVETFTATDRKAAELAKHDDITVVALEGAAPLSPETSKALLQDHGLYDLMRRCFAQTNEKGKPADSLAAVLAISGRVYLAVASPLYEGLQEYSIIGVGAVLVELSSEWAMRNRARTPGENPIEQVIVAGGKATSHTFGDEKLAKATALALENSTGEVFEVELDSGDGNAVYVGRRAYFDLAPGKGLDRPGFVALKNLDKELEPLSTLQRRVGIAGLVLGFLGAVIAYGGAYLVIRKLRVLQAAAIAVREGKFDTRVEIGGRDELGALGDAFNNMTTGLKALGIYTDHKLATTG